MLFSSHNTSIWLSLFIIEVIRKATVLKGRKFGNLFNEQYDTNVYCIVDSIYTVLDGINLLFLKQHAN